MEGREVAGVRRAITWLHEEAKKMNDPRATVVLNNAAFHLGVDLSRWMGKEMAQPSQPYVISTPPQGNGDDLNAPRNT